MFNLEDISTKKYLSLSKDKLKGYLELKEALRPKKTFAGRKARPIEDMTYREICTIKRCASNLDYTNLVSLYKIFFGVGKTLLNNQKATEFLASFKHIENEVQNISAWENRATQSKNNDSAWAAVDKTRLNAYSEYNVLATIAEKYKLKPIEVYKWKFSEVLTELGYRTASQDAQNEYLNLKYKKNATP